jgi:hypothetical protein
LLWHRRFEDWPITMPSFSIDGTDCTIQLPDARLAVRPNGQGGVHGGGAFISHKHSVAALRYWVCMHICKPIIIGVGGGYPAGAFHDIVVARRDVVPLMQGNERGIADHGYHDDRYHDAVEDKSLARKRLDPTLVAAYEQAMKFVSGRHEHVNAELKEFAVLRERFRHDPVLHPVCFRAVAMLTQLRFELNPSIIPASPFAPVFVEEDDDHLKCYGHGSAETRHTSINEEFVYRASSAHAGARRVPHCQWLAPNAFYKIFKLSCAGDAPTGV